MGVSLINPANGLPLERDGDAYVDGRGTSFPIVRGVPRICDAGNYTENFGKQWNAFPLTQIDNPEAGRTTSEDRFFETTGWKADDMKGQDVLEVGSGAGRFSRVVLQRTDANLFSVDYSNAVEANLATNGALAPGRFHLFQASIYELPFPDGSFDKVFCMGVLQHTPDFAASVRALVDKARPGGEIVVDFYPIRGFWTKLHAKYLLRPITRRMSHERLMSAIEKNAGWMIGLSKGLHRIGLGALTRFVPICDIHRTLPKTLTKRELREWVVLDTFDMFSPEYDHPQRLETVAEMFRRSGARVAFSAMIPIGAGTAAVVRAVKA
jgi:SAM-dependent methyltransferase